mmetsp:Transcript_18453/g.53903  ORF Transcript_18453/g.53903 Transcript_18453/m.53903 type:complete len:250 (+) Transcript_18453:437-1186(+)
MRPRVGHEHVGEAVHAGNDLHVRAATPRGEGHEEIGVCATEVHLLPLDTHCLREVAIGVEPELNRRPAVRLDGQQCSRGVPACRPAAESTGPGAHPSRDAAGCAGDRDGGGLTGCAREPAPAPYPFYCAGVEEAVIHGAAGHHVVACGAHEVSSGRMTPSPTTLNLLNLPADSSRASASAARPDSPKPLSLRSRTSSSSPHVTALKATASAVAPDSPMAFTPRLSSRSPCMRGSASASAEAPASPSSLP